MTEKPKRKNAPPTPKAYWWIFGTLAFVLLIGLRFPVRILSTWWLNPVIFGLFTFGFLVAMIFIIRRHSWKNWLVAIIFSCGVMTGWQTYMTLAETVIGVTCEETQQRITTCNVVNYLSYSCADFITLPNIPIGVNKSMGFASCQNIG